MTTYFFPLEPIIVASAVLGIIAIYLPRFASPETAKTVRAGILTIYLALAAWLAGILFTSAFPL